MNDEKEVGRPSLAKQAADVRRERIQEKSSLEQALPGWKRKLFVALSLTAVGVAVGLLIAEDARRGAVQFTVSRLLELTDQGGGGIFPLPAPPPKTPRSTVVFGGARPSSAAGEVFEPALTPAPGSASTPTEKPFVAPEKNASSQQAFDMLIENTELVRRLVDNELDGYEFTEWRPRQARPPVFFLDLVATRTEDGRELTFIWQINAESGEARPLDQNARDLTAQFRTP